MKIGIIGTGAIGTALCTALTKKEYRVMVGGRDLNKANEVAGQMDHFAQGGTIANAIHFGEIVFLAVPYAAVEEVLRASDNYKGKIIVDCTNPLIFGEVTSLALGHTTSAAEQIAKMIPDATVVKAYNTAPAKLIAEGPYFGPNDASMFYCGDDEEAKASVAKVIEATGFEPVDCGGLESARLLEPMAAMIVRLAFNYDMGPEIAFKLLRRG